jgi:hypothetical protein
MAEESSEWDVPSPVLLNLWKHHAGAIRERIAAVARSGPAALAALAGELSIIGADLMDLYHGPLTPRRIAEGILSQLRAAGRLPPDAYRSWLDENRGYRVVTLDDGAHWVLRHGEDADRYVHVHPGRWSPGTLRVRANVLKTAVMVRACVAVEGGDPLDRELINRTRQQFLGLPPIRALAESGGLREVIELLAPRPDSTTSSPAAAP